MVKSAAKLGIIFEICNLLGYKNEKNSTFLSVLSIFITKNLFFCYLYLTFAPLNSKGLTGFDSRMGLCVSMQ